MVENAVITGVGCVTRAGLGLEPVEALIAGESVAPPDPELLEQAFRPFVGRKQAKYVVKITGYGIAAAGQAIDDAGLRDIGWEESAVGVFSASSVRPPKLETDQRRRLRRLSEAPGPSARRPWQLYNLLHDPTDLLRGMVSAPGDHTTVVNGFRGATCTFLGGAPSGLTALAEAARRIRWGDQRAMVVIASDGLANPWWNQLAEHEGRKGGARGASEGADAAVGLVIESEASARGRGTRIYARLEAGSLRSGGERDARGALARALCAALGAAGRSADEVNALLHSGISEAGDGAIVRVCEEAFGGGRRPRALHARRACGDVGVAAGLLDVALAARGLAGLGPVGTQLGARVLVAARGASGEAAAALLEAA